MDHIDPNDPVVAELDVLVSNELATLQSQLIMLQQALRPNWRPYDTDRSGSTAKFKAQARRLELSLPLDTKGDNYGDCNEEHKQTKTLTLKSSNVEDAAASYAVGVIRGHQLLLMPLDYTLQLRPDMSFLNLEAGKKKVGEESDEEEPPADEAVMAVEVTVKRRETERQQQARLKSYSYLQQEEQQEPWVPLQMYAPESTAADALWNKLLSAPGTVAAAEAQGATMPPQLSRSDYLQSLVPGSVSAALTIAGLADVTTTTADGAALTADGIAMDQDGSPAPDAGANQQSNSVTQDVVTAVQPVLKALAARHPVCSMANVRQWLQQQEKIPLARAAAQLSENLLDGLIQKAGHMLAIKRMYVAKTGTNLATEPLRKVVVQLLQEKATVRKADVSAAASAAGINVVPESQYQRVMKELCRNNGSSWVIKTSADM